MRGADRLIRLTALGSAAMLLVGCQGFREATGTAKLAPDEFTVVTKAPLIIPPDYNLRPPRPGAPDFNQADPDDQARTALFQQDPKTAAAALGATYSDGEKTLLAKTGGASADPNIRKQIGGDSGYTDQGDAYAQKILYPQAPQAAPAAAPPAAPAAPAPAPMPATAAPPAAAPPAAAPAPSVRGTTE